MRASWFGFVSSCVNCVFPQFDGGLSAHSGRRPAASGPGEVSWRPRPCASHTYRFAMPPRPPRHAQAALRASVLQFIVCCSAVARRSSSQSVRVAHCIRAMRLLSLVHLVVKSGGLLGAISAPSFRATERCCNKMLHKKRSTYGNKYRES